LLRHPTLDQLHALGLHGMAKAFAEITAGGEADGLGHHEWLGLLLDREASWRQDKRLAARLRVAKLRQQACVEDVDYRAARGLDRALFQKLSEGEWIEKAIFATDKQSAEKLAELWAPWPLLSPSPFSARS